MSDSEGDSRELIDAAIARARQAQAGWALLSFRERGRALRRLAAFDLEKPRPRGAAQTGPVFLLDRPEISA